MPAKLNVNNMNELAKIAFNNYQIKFSQKYFNIAPSAIITNRLKDLPTFDKKPYVIDFINNRDESSLPNYSKFDKSIKYIINYLNYIPMKPSNAKHHENTYVIKDGSSGRDIITELLNGEIININEYRNDFYKIMMFWIEKAVEIAHSEEPNIELIADTVFTLVGEPGVGKTALLNYAFSFFSPQLIEKKVMWIRVNLNNVDNVHVDLDSRLHRKIFKIFSEHYSWEMSKHTGSAVMNDMKEDLVGCLQDWQIGSDLEDGYYEKVVEDIYNIIRTVKRYEKRSTNYSLDDLLASKKIDEMTFGVVVNSMLEYLQKKVGYSYLFIFDGLDNVSLDYIQYDIYNKWVGDIFKISSNNKKSPYKAIYIITTRLYSYLDKLIKNLNGKQCKNKVRIAKVINQEFSEILIKRFMYAHEMMSEEQKEKHDYPKDYFTNIATTLICLLEMCLRGSKVDDFIISCMQMETLKDERRSLLLRVTNNSCRSAFRLFREILTFLGNKWKDQTFDILNDNTGNMITEYLRGKEWALYRLIIYSKIDYKLYSNRITYSPQGLPGLVTDYRGVIHNIFNYNNKKRKLKNSPISRILLKWHALKILEIKGEMTIDELMEYLSKIYQKTNESIIKDDILELIYNGLAYPSTEQLIEAAEAETYDDFLISITSAGRYLINNIVNHFIYWETISDDIPIDHRFVEGTRAIHHNDKRVTISLYLAIKAKTTIHLLLYCSKVEETLAKEYELKKYSNAYNIDGYKLITDELVESVMSGIENSWAVHADKLNEVDKIAFLKHIRTEFSI